MAAKFALVLIAACLAFVMFYGTDATAIRREAPTAAKPSDASQTIDEALQSFKTGLDDLVKNIQGNELFQNVSASLQQFGEQVQAQSKQLVEKIQTSAPKN